MNYCTFGCCNLHCLIKRSVLQITSSAAFPKLILVFKMEQWKCWPLNRILYSFLFLFTYMQCVAGVGQWRSPPRLQKTEREVWTRSPGRACCIVEEFVWASEPMCVCNLSSSLMSDWVHKPARTPHLKLACMNACVWVWGTIHSQWVTLVETKQCSSAHTLLSCHGATIELTL